MIPDTLEQSAFDIGRQFDGICAAGNAAHVQNRKNWLLAMSRCEYTNADGRRQGENSARSSGDTTAAPMRSSEAASFGRCRAADECLS